MGRGKQKKDPESNGSDPGRSLSPEGRKGLFGHTREPFLLSFLAILVFLIYSNTFGGPFIFDDVPNIRNNPHIRLTKFSWKGLARAGFKSPSSNRPVANISFALNYYFNGYNVWGYRLVNILVHVTTGFMIYFFVKTTLGIPSLRSRSEDHVWIPWLTALIWVVHPVNTQSVTYVVQRMNSMAALFYVLSLLLYAKARLARGKGKKWASFAGCVLAGILALGSKEIALTLPLFIFLYEWYFFKDLSLPWLKHRVLHFLGILIILAVVAFLFLQSEAGQRKLSLYDFKGFTLTERVLTEFRVVMRYISLLIFPHPSRLNLDYDFPLSHSLVDPGTTLLSMIAIAGFIGLAIYMAKKERLLSFCVLWFLGNLVIESSVIGLDIIFEHRTYLPSMLVILMAVVLGGRWIKPRSLGVGLVCVVVGLFSFWTYERNNIWTDRVRLWSDCVAKSPNKPRLHLNLGVALVKEGKVEEAINHYMAALRIDRNFAEAHNNLGVALKREGKIKEAIAHYTEALRIKPEFAEAENNMGVALESLGRIDEAISHHLEAVKINPNYGEAYNSLGVALEKQGKLEEAIKNYREALRLKPDYATAHYNLGSALMRQGKVDLAIMHFYRALRLKPDYAKAHYNLGVALYRQGDRKGAAFHFSEVLRIKPGDARARYALELLSK